MKTIKGYEDYTITRDGTLVSHKGGNHKYIKPDITSKGYKKVSIWNNGKRSRVYIHRLVAISYISNPLCKRQVNHINGNKTDNRVENLEWVTNLENMKHAYVTGLKTYKQLRIIC